MFDKGFIQIMLSLTDLKNTQPRRINVGTDVSADQEYVETVLKTQLRLRKYHVLPVLLMAGISADVLFKYPLLVP